jgi:hypothetical protein
MAQPAATLVFPFRTVVGLLRPDLKTPEEGLHVIRSADEWNRQWAGSSADRTPAVDWATEMCVVVALGIRPTSGYFALIDLILVTGDLMRVRAWEIRPGPDCGVMRAITHPFYAVAVPAHAGAVELSTWVAFQDCEGTGF